MQNNTVARIIFSQVHWETFARYAVKVLGNTMSREEVSFGLTTYVRQKSDHRFFFLQYLDAVGFSTGLTMSLMQQVNGTVIRQDVVTTARKFVGNFLKAYLLMNNQYFSFMDHSIGWLADDIALYTADDILRVRVPAGTPATRGEWDKYAKAASQGLRNLRLISIGLLMSYRNGPMSLQFQPPEVLGSMVPPAWMAMRYQFPAV
ncbi:hypothetical protein RvY_02631-2 [Ramazzottius varieornatus]|uniref:Uncharacterized protein n=1 Tax=Ramazzottius varieornatus TaxID=947166 RepID=A0A1D1UP51_RAMVA|nr:hypothetical protein RvY_02631-2 [Ramazzottius varieornatus]